MKFSPAAFTLFLFAGSTTAQYFSAGWSPGQKVSKDKSQPAKAFDPQQVVSSSQTVPAAAAAETSSSPSSLIEKLLASGPAKAILGPLGLSKATRDKLWDERIQLITDDNYEDLIVNEPLTSNEEKERAWVIVITGQAVRQDDVSKLADHVFDTAYEQTLQANDLPHIKWGRIDYLNVTRLTTKWVVWQAPYIVIATNRGQTLRFYRHYQVRLRAENLREFLKTKGYLLTPPWASSYGPGGEREYILNHFANILTKVYGFVVMIPRWLLVFISGSIGSLVVAILHRTTAKSTPKPASNEKKPSPATPAIQSNGTASSKPSAKPPAADTAKPARAGSPAKSTLTPAATDSELESSGKPTKRASARTKKTKKV